METIVVADCSVRSALKSSLLSITVRIFFRKIFEFRIAKKHANIRIFEYKTIHLPTLVHTEQEFVFLVCTLEYRINGGGGWE